MDLDEYLSIKNICILGGYSLAVQTLDNHKDGWYHFSGYVLLDNDETGQTNELKNMLATLLRVKHG